MKWTAHFNISFSLLALAMMPIGILGSTLGIWGYRVAQLASIGSVILGLLAISMALIVRIFCSSDTTRRETLMSCLLPLPPITVALWFVLSNQDAVMIHHISTDWDTPPTYQTLLKQRGPDANPLTVSDENTALQQQHYPSVKPIITGLGLEASKSLSQIVMRELGWEIADLSTRPNYIEATETSFLFRYVDDISVRFTEEGEKTRIDLRSISRVGRSDLGANAKRIERFTRRFNELSTIGSD